VASNKLEPLLGVFQKLVASKVNDHEGFYLIQTIVEFLPAETINNYVKSIFTLVRGRPLSTSYADSFPTLNATISTYFGA
jgi:exportin-2 (importin alpha re-exporter)